MELKKDQLFRGDTARRTEFGSVLQAYCRDRGHSRIIANWGHEKYLAPAYSDGGVIGSRIALFACPAAQALETIGAIEVAEGLPHPMLDRAWAKVATNANCSYLIVDFSEQTVDRAIEMTRRTGLEIPLPQFALRDLGPFSIEAEPLSQRLGRLACLRRESAPGRRARRFPHALQLHHAERSLCHAEARSPPGSHRSKRADDERG